MAAVNFPNLERHKIGHQAFVDELHKLQQRYQQGSISVAAQLSSALRDWLSLHIRRNDKELHDFLRQQERAQARARQRAKR
jgi:hemerythrin